MGTMNASAKTEDQKQQILQILYDTGKIVNSSLELPIILRNIVRIVGMRLKYDHFSILLVKEGNLLLAATHKPPKALQANFPLPLGKGIVGMAAKRGKVMLVNDVKKDRLYIALDKRMHSELAVPILVGKKTIGAFNVESTGVGAFDEDDVFFFSALAEQTAIAIQNAKI